jgi:hypothetical protein
MSSDVAGLPDADEHVPVVVLKSARGGATGGKARWLRGAIRGLGECSYDRMTIEERFLNGSHKPATHTQVDAAKSAAAFARKCGESRSMLSRVGSRKAGRHFVTET